MASGTRGRSYGLTQEEVDVHRNERQSAEDAGMGWSERGPPPTWEGGPQHWRGQTYRNGLNGGTQRWANRGGKHREYYANLARQGRIGNIKGKGKGKDTDGSNMHGGSSSSSSYGKGDGKGNYNSGW